MIMALLSRIRLPPMTVVVAITAPTDTSIPPTRITSVWPSATIMSGAACRRMLTRFVVLRKSEEIRVDITTSPMRIAQGP